MDVRWLHRWHRRKLRSKIFLYRRDRYRVWRVLWGYRRWSRWCFWLRDRPIYRRGGRRILHRDLKFQRRFHVLVWWFWRDCSLVADLRSRYDTSSSSEADCDWLELDASFDELGGVSNERGDGTCDYGNGGGLEEVGFPISFKGLA